jgi:hypothetical protein
MFCLEIAHTGQPFHGFLVVAPSGLTPDHIVPLWQFVATNSAPITPCLVLVFSLLTPVYVVCSAKYAKQRLSDRFYQLYRISTKIFIDT